MKKIILVVAAFVIGAIFVSCETPAKKVENAKEDVVKANENLDKANQDYMDDVEKYKKINAEKIASNDQAIAEFNARIENEKNNVTADYKQRIAKLEQKNNDMKKRMADYKVESKEKWEMFKTEYNYDMDELGRGFKDLTVKNVK
jgi:hypothetical protein